MDVHSKRSLAGGNCFEGTKVGTPAVRSGLGSGYANSRESIENLKLGIRPAVRFPSHVSSRSVVRTKIGVLQQLSNQPSPRIVSSEGAVLTVHIFDYGFDVQCPSRAVCPLFTVLAGP